MPCQICCWFANWLRFFSFFSAHGGLRIDSFSARRARWGAVLLAACCFTLPVAGTSLSIMDPYVTARSFSTPLGLFALAAVLEENWVWSVFWLALAALLHPLMAVYAAIAMLTVALTSAEFGDLSVCSMAWDGCCAQPFSSHPSTRTATLAYNRAALSRSYFFLSSWKWYEYPGLLIPLLLLGVAGTHKQAPWPARALAIAATYGQLRAAGIAVFRASQRKPAAGPAASAARLPVCLHRRRAAGRRIVGQTRNGAKRVIAALCLLLAGALFAGQRLTYPESNHVEWPGLTPRNRWQQAFLWIRSNTPKDAIFALDNDYIESPGEDAQGFRATAERSAVADWYKDGGIASNFPQAAIPWWQGSRPRSSSIAPQMSSGWPGFGPSASPGSSCLPRQARASCPFINARVRVCRLAVCFTHDGAK